MRSENKELLLIGSHALLLKDVKQVLEQIPEVVVADVATTIEVANRLVTSRSFELYMMCVDFFDDCWFDLIKKIRTRRADALIVVKTTVEDVLVINRLVNCSVNSIILKSLDIRDVEKSVLGVLNGEYYYSLRFKNLGKVGDGTYFEHHKSDTLTFRELEVLQSIAKGNSTSQIAQELNISVNTVETFRKRLMQKINAKNAIDMVMKALNQGWIFLDGSKNDR